MRFNRSYRWLAALAAGAALTGVACGGSGGGSGSDVASLSAGSGESAAGQQTADKKETDKDPEEAMLDFSRCMREHGIDMPDPQVSGTGGGAGEVKARAAIRVGGDVDPEKMEEANEACRPLLGDAGPLREMSPEERQEMQDKMVEHAQCMREHGIDMPDPTFDSGSGGAMVKIEAGRKGAIDFDSEEFAAAQEACGDIFGGGKGGVGFSVAPGGGKGGSFSVANDEDAK